MFKIFKKKPIKNCEDCKYFRPSETAEKMEHHCMNTNVIYNTAVYGRNGLGSGCGKRGKLWTPKNA